MNEDIVSRLNSSYVMLGDPLHKEAAEEIEQLREMRADWRAAMTENHDLWRENERLRAALREAREDILLRHNARGSEYYETDEEAVSFIDAALAGEKTDAQNHVS
jgi:regulator of replication initiation timing